MDGVRSFVFPGTDPAMADSETQPPARRRRLRRFAIDGGLILLVFLAIGAWQTRNLIASGTAAPDFTLRDLEGRPHRLAESQGRKVLLYFWAPWCGVCKAVAPNVASVAKSAGDDVEVLSIALSYRSEEDVARVAREHGIPGTVLLGDASVREAYSIDAYPTFYLLGADGTIRHSLVGYSTWLGLRARLLWASL